MFRPPYTPDDVAAARRMRAAGLSYREVAHALGRESGAGVQELLARQDARDTETAYRISRGLVSKIRKCQRCQVRFKSPHAGVRRCDPCRGISVSPYEPDHPGGLEDVQIVSTSGGSAGA